MICSPCLVFQVRKQRFCIILFLCDCLIFRIIFFYGTALSVNRCLDSVIATKTPVKKSDLHVLIGSAWQVPTQMTGSIYSVSVKQWQVGPLLWISLWQSKRSSERKELTSNRHRSHPDLSVSKPPGASIYLRDITSRASIGSCPIISVILIKLYYIPIIPVRY